MTLLSICQNASNNAGVNVPSSIIGNTDPAALRLLQLARREGLSLSRRINWTALVTEYTFTANGQSDYPLPPDYRSLIDDTLWDKTQFLPMRGAMSPQQWQFYKNSTLGNATYERRWRIRLPSGAVAGAPTVFSIDPPIISDNTTEQFVFEYVSNYWCRSATNFALEEAVIDVAGTGYVIGDTVTLADGTFTAAAILTVTSVGTDGGIATCEVTTPGVYTVAPSSPAIQSATSGSGIGASFTITTTTMGGAAQPDWAADTDTGILDENLIELGVIWRVLARMGLAYAEERDEYEREVDRAIARDGGTAVLSLAPRYYGPWLGIGNIPDGNWPSGF